jgi:hypothetical protein
MPFPRLPSQNRLLSAAFAAGALLTAASSTLRAQRPETDAVAVAVGALHTDAVAFGASLTGSYVLSRNLLVLSLSPVDLGIGFGGQEGYHEDLGAAPGGGKACRDRNGGEVSSIRCNASVRYGASAQIIGLLPAEASQTIGFGVGYRAFDAAGPYAVAVVDLPTFRDARLYLRARGGSHFYDLALGATFSLERIREPQRPPVP